MFFFLYSATCTAPVAGAKIELTAQACLCISTFETELHPVKTLLLCCQAFKGTLLGP